MDLSCKEYPEQPVIAEKDSRIINDSRVVKNLLEQESFYVPRCDYFKIQRDIQPFMRQVVTTWMHEVCEEQLCEDQVFPLAVNCMDRFLCICPIKKQQLQLLGATCLLIASKLRSTNALTVDLLCAYTDNSVSYDHVVTWELLVLSKLSWNVSSITAFDYVDQVISRFPWGSENGLLGRHAHTLVSISYTEPALIQTLPSMIAAACLTSAIRGLKLRSTQTAIANICMLLGIDVVALEVLVRIIDQAVEKVVPRCPGPAAPEEKVVTTQGYESPKYGQPNTPTEVDNVYF